MNQVDYFKFFKVFPKFIDINENEDVKIGLLIALKKLKRKDHSFKLLPISLGSTIGSGIEVEELRNSGFKDSFYITHKKRKLFIVGILEKENDKRPTLPGRTVKYPLVAMSVHWTYFPGSGLYMSKDEFKSFKRTILIDDMLKNEK